MPEGIEIRSSVDGVDDLLHKLTRTIAADAREGPVERLVERVTERLKTYPPEPPGSSYQRTGNLGRGWAVSADALGTNQYADQVSVEMKNTVAYGPFVQGDPSDGDPHQAWMHVDRWETTRQVLDQETGPFLSDLQDSIRNTFGSH